MSIISIYCIFLVSFLSNNWVATQLTSFSPTDLDLVKGENATFEFIYNGNLTDKLHIDLFTSRNNLDLYPESFSLTDEHKRYTIALKAKDVTSRTFIDVVNCSYALQPDYCPFDPKKVFLRVRIVYSNVISWLVFLSGWIYFFAWSISFYPQIILNYQRKRFTTHSRSLIPVLLNDVVFAVHALLACIVTGFQCFIYERGNQRISYICRVWSSILITFAVVAFVVTLFEAINPLQFINYLAYVKMAITLSKYFPQAILNYKRKSTLGWSIGNVLLDFTGGFMDICQMILQASNTGLIFSINIYFLDDWSAFYGNPVKFGLGMISMVFDVVFIIQHYFLYRHSEEDTTYNQVQTAEVSTSQLFPSDYTVQTTTP